MLRISRGKNALTTLDLIQANMLNHSIASKEDNLKQCSVVTEKNSISSCTLITIIVVVFRNLTYVT